MNHIMVDVETLNLRDCVIQIGIVEFTNNFSILKRVQYFPEFDSSDIDYETLIWWLHKDPQLLRSILTWSRVPHSVVENVFKEYASKDYYLWAQPSQFDVPALYRYRVGTLFHRRVVDVRSFCWGAGVKYIYGSQKTAHDAVLDAEEQIDNLRLSIHPRTLDQFFLGRPIVR